MTLSRDYPHIAFQPRWQLPSTVHFQLGECAAIVQAICGIPLPPESHKSLMLISLRKGAQATTAIEGNTLSDEEIERIQEGGRMPPSKKYMELEVTNILNALNRLLSEVAIDGQTSLITPQLLQRFHEMIGRDLGPHFEALPGRFAQGPRVVGPYRAPDSNDVPELVGLLCDWLRAQFGFDAGGETQPFAEAVVQAIVTHVYIEWIHPFDDGNGRTGRLVEFYILLRAGLPDIASHILSNHYNDTRAEYYRQLNQAGRTGDLTGFISYAVEGFRDGLLKVLTRLQSDQVSLTWRAHIYDTFAPVKLEHRKRNVFIRRRNLALAMPTGRPVTTIEMTTATPELLSAYATVSPKTRTRDLRVLEDLGLVRRVGDSGQYLANTQELQTRVAVRRERRRDERSQQD